MPSVKRYKPLRPRRVANDVGAAVTGPQKILDWDQAIPVSVQVWWDDDTEPEIVIGLCLGWTREHVRVEITDPLTTYKYPSWVPAKDVTRLLL